MNLKLLQILTCDKQCYSYNRIYKHEIEIEKEKLLEIEKNISIRNRKT